MGEAIVFNWDPISLCMNSSLCIKNLKAVYWSHLVTETDPPCKKVGEEHPPSSILGNILVEKKTLKQIWQYSCWEKCQ